MTGTFCTGWDRNEAAEWTHMPNLIQRWVMVVRMRWEMRGW